MLFCIRAAGSVTQAERPAKAPVRLLISQGSFPVRGAGSEAATAQTPVGRPQFCKEAAWLLPASAPRAPANPAALCEVKPARGFLRLRFLF